MAKIPRSRGPRSKPVEFIGMARSAFVRGETSKRSDGKYHVTLSYKDKDGQVRSVLISVPYRDFKHLFKTIKPEREISVNPFGFVERTCCPECGSPSHLDHWRDAWY